MVERQVVQPRRAQALGQVGRSSHRDLVVGRDERVRVRQQRVDVIGTASGRERLTEDIVKAEKAMLGINVRVTTHIHRLMRQLAARHGKQNAEVITEAIILLAQT